MNLMRGIGLRGALCGLLLAAVAARAGGASVTGVGPRELRVDNLKTPLGIDDPAPRFSWQLRDPARGAKQTAYEVLVASRAELLRRARRTFGIAGGSRRTRR